MYKFTKKDYQQGKKPEHYIFYTDTYCEGITDNGFSDNGIVEIRGLVTEDFNILRAAEDFFSEIRDKYYSRYMDTLEELKDVDAFARKKLHIGGELTARDRIRAKQYLEHKRDTYMRAWRSLTLNYVDRETTVDITISDPVTPYESRYGMNIRTCDSTIMFLVEPVHKLDNRLNNKKESKESMAVVEKLAKTWK